MRFVATLGIARDTDFRNYFESHPRYSVAADIITSSWVDTTGYILETFGENVKRLVVFRDLWADRAFGGDDGERRRFPIVL